MSFGQSYLLSPTSHMKLMRCFDLIAIPITSLFSHLAGFDLPAWAARDSPLRPGLSWPSARAGRKPARGCDRRPSDAASCPSFTGVSAMPSRPPSVSCLRGFIPWCLRQRSVCSAYLCSPGRLLCVFQSSSVVFWFRKLPLKPRPPRRDRPSLLCAPRS